MLLNFIQTLSTIILQVDLWLAQFSLILSDWSRLSNWCGFISTNLIRLWWQWFALSSQNRSYEMKNTWTWDESVNVDKIRNWWQMGVGDIDLLMILKMEIILVLLNWILPFLIEIPWRLNCSLWQKSWCETFIVSKCTLVVK